MANFCNGSCNSLPVWFCGSVFGSADRMSLFLVGPNPRSQPSAILLNFEWPYLGNGSPVQFVFGSRVNV